jgi:shikimate dehydrogenase
MAAGDASGLIGTILTFAAEPRGNPRGLESPRYTLPLLGHDYPALTPAMWNACYARFGLDVECVAVVCGSARLGEVLETLRHDARYLGGGVGVGLKAEALPRLDSVDPVARAAGAVNLIRKTAGSRLIGHNTDGDGYTRSLEETLQATGRSLGGQKVLVLGAGGTGRAIALSLARRGADCVVLNRTPGRAAELAAHVNRLVDRSACRSGGEAQLRVEASWADVIVNTSTKGSSGPLEEYSALAEAPVPVTEEHVSDNREASRSLLASLSRDTIISDVVLRSGPTPTLALARGLGLPTLDGVGMVVHQGVEAFLLLHGDELRAAGIARGDVTAEMEKAVR